MLKNLDKLYTSLITERGLSARNEQFKALPEIDQKKEIAFDALHLVKLDLLKGSYSTYWSNSLLHIRNNCTTAAMLQEELQDLPNTCFVCARGAVMLSTIRIGNTISPDGCSVSNGDEDNIVGFTMAEMEEMEACYEGYNGYNGNTIYRMNSTELLANILLEVLMTGTFVYTGIDYLKLAEQDDE